MLNFSIMTLNEEYKEELCLDIERQVRDGIATMPLFCMTLTPEGIPTIDKADMLCRVYEQYKSILDRKGIPSGVLIQASIGHGYVLNEPSDIEKIVNLSDGRSPEVCCPLSARFQDYIRRAAARIARTRPSHIMLDDDFRLLQRGGCACDAHMKEFDRLAGTSLDREELYRALFENTASARKYREIFIKTQLDALILCAKEIRAGIDSVDPTIPGSYCLCGNGSEAAYEIASILAGEGNPVTVRVNNADYVSPDHRKFTHVMYRAATQIAALTGKPDIILAETDTCPQNRYSTPAARLHAHFTFSILEGAMGAKHWITKLSEYQPKSGEAYRKKLSKYKDFYEALGKITDGLTWLGCKIPVSPRPHFDLTPSDRTAAPAGWYSHVLDRFGLPMHFSKDGEGVYFFDGGSDEFFTDEELRTILSGNVVLDSVAARHLEKRGLGEYLGVKVAEYGPSDPRVSGELYPDGKRSNAQFGIHKLIPAADGVESLSDVYHLRDGKHKDVLFPGVTRYRNSLGGTAVVFGGQTDFPHSLGTAFGFLDEMRKRQLIDLLNRFDALPVYYPDDAEVLVKAARTKKGELLVAILDMSLDPTDELPLVINRDVRTVKRLCHDGEFKTVPFERDGERYTLGVTLEVFTPLILVIE